jgi:hypothetical protein
MKFNKNRMAKLAGLPGSKKRLVESRRRSILREHVSEMAHKHPHDDLEEGMYEEADLEEGMYEEADLEEGMYEEADLEEMVDIDEEELKKEVRNIKRKRINEARLKAVIEDELRDIISEMRYKAKFK